MKQIYLVPNRCMGCEECIEACAKVHDNQARCYLEVVDGYFPFPLRCQQCKDSPCKSVCPSEAIKRSENSLLVVDTQRCIGCGACAVVCPFGIPFVSETTGKAIKCDLCDERVSAGQSPVCVESCPKQALQFGECDEPLSQRRQRLAQQAKMALWP